MTVPTIKIGGVDFSHLLAHNGYAYSPNIIVSEGRDIRGNLSMDIINRKTKIFCKFIPMEQDDLQGLLDKLRAYVVEVEYFDPNTNQLSTMTAYVGEQKYEYYWILSNEEKLLNGFQINFIEM